MIPAVELTEVDAEVALLGSLFETPDLFVELGDEIDPTWFSDPVLRHVYQACTGLMSDGVSLSAPVIIAMLPEFHNGQSRAATYTNMRLAGLPRSQLKGLVTTLRDRWARRMLITAAESMKAAATPFGSDPFAIAQEAVLSLDTINASRNEKVERSLHGAAASLIDSLDRPEALRGVTTGLRAIDKRVNGYKAGQLYVIAGRPGMGKSAFMVSSMRRTAEAGYGVAIFSLEMTAEEIAARALSDSIGDVNSPGYGAILKGQLVGTDREELQAAAAGLAEIPMHIDASPRLTFSEIAARARRFKAKLEAEGRFLSVLCIDHMGLVTPSDRYRGNKVAEAGEVSGAARSLAKELDCCVVLLCQLSREVEKRDDKRPVMADLRWSGEIEQDAHVVAFLYREAYYLAQDASADPYAIQASRHRLEFLIRKNRNGETGDVPLYCSIAHSRVRDE